MTAEQSEQSVAQVSDRQQSRRVKMAANCLRLLFRCAADAPWLVRLLRKPIMWGTVRLSVRVRHGTFANARRILGKDISDQQCADFARRVVGRFCDFILAVGQSLKCSREELQSRVDSIEGEEAYLARRKLGGGAIIVTAHMGSFEIGLAALASVEPNIHVVFKRDEFDGFETIRRNLREKLGIREAAIDDGWSTWLNLRDALRANHVVVLQADRAMPGQKSEPVLFLGGHLRLPLGPVKLALASGSPIVPIFTVMTSPQKCSVFIQPPIDVQPDNANAALMQIGKAIEHFVAKYPDQWLVLHPAFVEDEEGA